MKRTPLKRKAPMNKSAKKHTRGWYSKRLDEIAKGFAKERDGCICQFSGEKLSGSNAHGSHVIPVSRGLALRWDLNNIKCLSYHYHLNWWHKNPMEAASWFKQTFPERWEYLTLRKDVPVSISTPSLIEFYNDAVTCNTPSEYEVVYRKHME